MHTIKLRVNDGVYEKLMWLLSKFNKEEVEIVTENSEFEKNREYLIKEYDEMIHGNANFMVMEDVEKRLDKYGNSI